MNYKIVIRPFVIQDVSDAVKYYKQISPQLAKKFLERVKEARDFIAENPFADDIMYKNIRVRLIKKFPYQIHYLIDEHQKRIIVLAIVFAKRKNLDFSQ